MSEQLQDTMRLIEKALIERGHPKVIAEDLAGYLAAKVFPEGQVNEADQGALDMRIGHDAVSKIVVIEFARPTKWVGFPADTAAQIGQRLIAHAREISDEPITITIGA